MARKYFPSRQFLVRSDKSTFVNLAAFSYAVETQPGTGRLGALIKHSTPPYFTTLKPKQLLTGNIGSASAQWRGIEGKTVD